MNYQAAASAVSAIVEPALNVPRGAPPDHGWPAWLVAMFARIDCSYENAKPMETPVSVGFRVISSHAHGTNVSNS